MPTTNNYPVRSDATVLLVEFENPSTAQTLYLPSPTIGRVVRMASCINNSIGGSDEVITLGVNGHTMQLTITQSGSAAGDLDSVEHSPGIPVDMETSIHISSSGLSTGAYKARLAITFIPTGV
jgi:hypothetical protein